MTESLPAPLTAPDCDLRHFRDLPLDVHRLRDSDLITHEDPEAVVAALLLWGAAWHQVPAGSLPDDDRILARYAGYGRALDAWLRVREGAMRGFVLCQDGRLYHRTLAAKANEAWRRHLEYGWAKAKDRHRKAQKDLPEQERSDFPAFDSWVASRAHGCKDQASSPKTPPRRQESLPLEMPGSSTGTPPCARPPAHPAHARTGASPVPTANSSGNDDQFQRNGAAIPLETALKGKERKGILSTQPDSSHSQPARAEPPRDGSGREDEADPGSGRMGSTDLKGLLDAVLDAAGWHPQSPGAIDRALRVVEDWRKRGIDFETVVLPSIRAVVSETREPTRTLGRFRARVDHEHARLAAKTSQGQTYRPPESPLLDPPNEDPAFRPMRQALLERLGPLLYPLLLNDVTFEAAQQGDRRPIIVHGKSFMIELVVHGENSRAIVAVARKHGFTELWKGTG